MWKRNKSNQNAAGAWPRRIDSWYRIYATIINHTPQTALSVGSRPGSRMPVPWHITTWSQIRGIPEIHYLLDHQDALEREHKIQSIIDGETWRYDWTQYSQHNLNPRYSYAKIDGSRHEMSKYIALLIGFDASILTRLLQCRNGWYLRSLSQWSSWGPGWALWALGQVQRACRGKSSQLLKSMKTFLTTAGSCYSHRWWQWVKEDPRMHRGLLHFC